MPVLYHFTSSPAMDKGSNFSTSYPALSDFFYNNYLNGCEVYLIVVLICISLMTSEIEHLFVCLLAIRISSLEKRLFSFEMGFVVVVIEL